jgi:hypothetical protein
MFFKSKKFRKDIAAAVTGGLIVSLLMWTAGFHYLQLAHAASLTNVSDTLSDSRPSFPSNHNIVFNNPSSTPALATITYTFDPITSAFTGVGNVTTANVTSTGMNIVSTCSAGTDNVTMSTSTNALTFTVCSGNSLAIGTTTLDITGNVITNPSSTGSYIIRITPSAGTVSDTRVAIVNEVQVTAAVATTFTFTVAGLATSTTLLNGATTTGAGTTTTLPFGTINPNTHNELGQQLYVTTNASNGFAVTVHEDQDMVSSKGNTIHTFINGADTFPPTGWVAPSSIINRPATYGHFGITSDDASDTVVGGPNYYGSSSVPLYAGSFNPTSTLLVFGWNGPADGVTQNVGTAQVAYRIEIGPLQAAANDYANNIIYVATPVF